MNREELYRIWRAEKSEVELQRLQPSFYAEARKLLGDCRTASALAGQDRTQKAIADKELKMVQRLCTEIARTRMKKMVNAALSRSKIGTEAFAEEETEFANTIAARIGDYNRFVDELGKSNVLSEEETVSKPTEERLEVVRFLSDFPAIIGVDLKTYGPFRSEDIATLPVENASALISQGVVKPVRFSEGMTTSLST
jgi:DNA replication factor GINS